MTIAVTPLNPHNNHELAFMAQLIHECRDQLTDDLSQDIAFQVCALEQDILAKRAFCLLVLHDGVPIGAAWCDLAGDVATLSAGLLKDWRRGWVAVVALREVLAVAFAHGIRKVKATIPITNRPAEKVCRWVGMKKEGMLRAEYLKDGEPIGVVLLGLLKSEWEGRNRVSRIKRVKCA